jgi:glycolate oxidase iron-sulfur subunit
VTHSETLPQLIQEASRCVACGLCVPHCPTYRKTQSEADSPRGRIALIKGVLEQRIPLGDKFIQHIDLCLTCRACEAVCPSGVRYGRLVDGVRPLIKRGPRGWREAMHKSMLRKVLPDATRLRWLGGALRFYQYSGVQAWARRSGLLERLGVAGLERELPPLPPTQSWRTVYPASGPVRGEVGMFLGCVARLVDVETLNATIFVLNRLGYTVHVPKTQTCCGALHQHDGEVGMAATLARRNIDAFAQAMPVLSAASGCGAWLSEYPLAVGDEAVDFAGRVMDVNAFLAQAAGWDKVEIQRLAAKIAVQDACTLRNVLRQNSSPYALLQRIPQAEIVALPGNGQCCGAAGNYHLEQPAMAGALLGDKIAAIEASAPRYLATANIGCALWLAQGLREKGMDIEVVHPVTLLARQMGFVAQ